MNLKLKLKPYLAFNWQIALVAVLLAVTLWYAVVGREKVESWVEVPLEIKGLPAKYILNAAPPDFLRVRVRGPEGLMRALDRRKLQYTLDLTTVTRGSNTVSLLPEDMPFSGAFEVLEIVPPTLDFFVDTLSTRKAVITPVLRDALPKGLRLGEMAASPHSVTLRGPESVISQLSEVNATVAMPPDITQNAITTQAHVIPPPGVQAQPTEVSIKLDIKGSRKVLTVQAPIVVQGNLPDNSSIDPEVVEVHLDVPLAWTAGGPELRSLAAVVEANEKMKDSVNLPIRVTAPENCKVIKVTPNRVTLTIL